VGGTIPNISLSDLKSLPVWLATAEEQQPFIEAFEGQTALAREIAERSAEQQQIEKQAWVDARLTLKE
jgi:restriction endonuclease S subunit